MSLLFIKVSCSVCNSKEFVEVQRFFYDYYGLHSTLNGYKCCKCEKFYTKNEFNNIAQEQLDDKDK